MLQQTSKALFSCIRRYAVEVQKSTIKVFLQEILTSNSPKQIVTFTLRKNIKGSETIMHVKCRIKC